MSRNGKHVARVAAVLAAAMILIPLLETDPVATITAGVAAAGVLAAAKWRKPMVLRAVLLVLVTAIGLGAAAVALGMPSYHGRPTPLMVAGGTPPAPVPARGKPQREVLGFAATDFDDTPSGLARDGGRLTTVAATTGMLRPPGRLDLVDANNVLAHARANGARALAVVTNEKEDDGFDGRLADTVFTDPAAAQQVAGRIAESTQQWDGVVLDMEDMPASSRAVFPQFVARVKQAIGQRRLLVATPAFTDDHEENAAAFDLTAISRACDGIVWMAYDEHTSASPPGPVASTEWVRQTVRHALRSVPPSQLLLGVAGYGYEWDRGGKFRNLTQRDLLDLQHSPGARTSTDPSSNELRVDLPDGSVAFFAGAASAESHAQLANTFNLGGVALWRVGSEDPATLGALPFATRRESVLPNDVKSVNRVSARGVVALSFDDGPDPQWTPRILDVLRREHVPATFFDIGKDVEAAPDVVRTEVADGHAVGNHTYSHPHPDAIPAWEFQYELWRGSAALEATTGYRPTLFRAPYGEGGRTSRQLGKASVADLVRQAGLHPVSWQVDTLDYENPGVDRIVHNAVSTVGDNDILLLHDGGGDRTQTLAALPRIIDELRARGFVFTTVDALDGGVGTPYAVRHGLADNAAGLATITAFRLLHGVGLALGGALLLGVLAGLVRVLIGVPGGLVHANRRRRARRGAGPPAVPAGLRTAVLIPAYNEAEVIGKTLTSLAHCSPAPDQVIVVDDGSADGTADVARRYADLLPQLLVITQPNGGKAAALNTGLASTAADVLVVVDADTVVTPGLIGALAAPFADPGVGAVAGNVKVGNRRNLLAALQSLEYVVSLNIDRRAQDLLNIITVVPGAAGAFRRQALREVGGYPSETIVEDADLTQSLLRARWRIRYAPTAIVYTEAPQTIRDVVKQRRRWSYGTVQVVAKHAPALLDPRSGRAGMAGLPWLVMTQVVLPAAGPLADLWLLWCLVTARFGVVGDSVLLAIAADLALTVVAIVLDGESWRMILFSPLLRMLWRPLQLVIVARALASWLSGREEQWRKITRYATVTQDGAPRSRGDAEQEPPAERQLTEAHSGS